MQEAVGQNVRPVRVNSNSDLTKTCCNNMAARCVLISMRISQRIIFGAILVVCATQLTKAQTLQEMIDRAESGATVTVPKGKWTEPLQIKKALTIRGENAAECVIEVTSDNPAVFVESKGAVQIENVTVRWKRETSDRKPFIQAGLVAKDTKLKLAKCPIPCAGRQNALSFRAHRHGILRS